MQCLKIEAACSNCSNCSSGGDGGACGAILANRNQEKQENDPAGGKLNYEKRTVSLSLLSSDLLKAMEHESSYSRLGHRTAANGVSISFR